MEKGTVVTIEDLKRAAEYSRTIPYKPPAIPIHRKLYNELPEGQKELKTEIRLLRLENKELQKVNQ